MESTTCALHGITIESENSSTATENLNPLPENVGHLDTI